MNRGKPDAVFFDELMILNIQFTDKKFFLGNMKIMHKPGVIDNTGAIDITKADF
jgi:hypothetical protein